MYCYVSKTSGEVDGRTDGRNCRLTNNYSFAVWLAADRTALIILSAKFVNDIPFLVVLRT